MAIIYIVLSSACHLNNSEYLGKIKTHLDFGGLHCARRKFKVGYGASHASFIFTL